MKMPQPQRQVDQRVSKSSKSISFQKCQLLSIAALILVQSTYIFISGGLCIPSTNTSSASFHSVPSPSSQKNDGYSLQNVIANDEGNKPAIGNENGNSSANKDELTAFKNENINIDKTIAADDKRLTVNRPYMNTVAHSMLDSISDIEKVYPTSDDCSSWGGKRFFDELLSSSKELVQNATNAKSSVTLMKHSASNMHIFHAKNVSLTLTSQGSFHSAHDKAHDRGQWLKNAQPKLTLGVDGRISLPDIKGGSMLENLNSVAMNNGDCDVHIEYPVMLVDSGLDSWNWWFFLQSILHHYIVVAALQPEIMGDYQRDALRVLFTSHDVMYSRSNLDAFDFLFSDRRGRDSTQLWSLESDKKLCFRQLIFSPSFTGGGHMLVNRIHKHDSCFASVVYSYAAYLKAALHIPTLPRPSKPRVVWVSRDTSSAANWNSWQRQRIINNQPQLIEFLRKKCSELDIELMVADFYGDKKETPFQEQALFISKANIMIGMHGAGLNMFHFMPFNSVVIEIHKGTTANKNSRNYVQHIKEGAYLTTSVNPGDKGLDENKIWELLKEGIDKWESLGTQSFPITTSKLRRST